MGKATGGTSGVNTYHRTKSVDSLTSHDIDKAIKRALKELTEEHGPVILLNTSMAMERDLLFVTVIASPANADDTLNRIAKQLRYQTGSQQGLS
jgi:hypothetical protein